MSAKRNVHLVGSVGLDDPESVFRSLAGALGANAPRMPDGECGPRASWITWQADVIEASPSFELAETFETHFGGEVRTFKKYKLADGVTPEEAAFGALGYAEAARESYPIFRRLKEEGVVPEATRFQVELPTPVAVCSHHFNPPYQIQAEPAYERALAAEIDAISGIVPPAELAVQWDVCQEVLAAEDAWEVYYDDLVGGALERLQRLSTFVPEPIQLGFHLCYGDPGHAHIKEPPDLSMCVTFANGICARVGRPVNFIHMPVPRDRDDDAYFQPLAGLDLTPGTELFLGLVHLTDGLAGAKRRIAGAEAYVSDFGIATECGFGRRNPETIPELLQLHADIAAA